MSDSESSEQFNLQRIPQENQARVKEILSKGKQIVPFYDETVLYKIYKENFSTEQVFYNKLEIIAKARTAQLQQGGDEGWIYSGRQVKTTKRDNPEVTHKRQRYNFLEDKKLIERARKFRPQFINERISVRKQQNLDGPVESNFEQKNSYQKIKYQEKPAHSKVNQSYIQPKRQFKEKDENLNRSEIKKSVKYAEKKVEVVQKKVQKVEQPVAQTSPLKNSVKYAEKKVEVVEKKVQKVEQPVTQASPIKNSPTTSKVNDVTPKIQYKEKEPEEKKKQAPTQVKKQTKVENKVLETKRETPVQEKVVKKQQIHTRNQGLTKQKIQQKPAKETKQLYVEKKTENPVAASSSPSAPVLGHTQAATATHVQSEPQKVTTSTVSFGSGNDLKLDSVEVEKEFENSCKQNAFVLKFIKPTQKLQKVSYIRYPNGTMKEVKVREPLNGNVNN